RGRSGADRCARVLVPPALSLLSWRLRALGPHRPATCGHRDDDRATARTRDVRLPAPAAAATPPAPRHRVSATDFSFEPLYLVLAAVAAAAYVSAARDDRPARWKAVSFGVGVFLVAASLNSPLETIAAHRLLMVHLLQNAL